MKETFFEILRILKMRYVVFPFWRTRCKLFGHRLEAQELCDGGDFEITYVDWCPRCRTKFAGAIEKP